MSSQSPSSVLYSSDGYELAVVENSSYVVGTRGILSAGLTSLAAPSFTDGYTNYLSLDTSGNLRVTVATGGASSLGQNGTTAPTYSDQVGGLISTSQPNYTTMNGDIQPISLDGYGNLRVAMTGGAVGSTGSTAPTLAVLEGALVSLSNPDYTSNAGALEPLSLDGYGNLRVTMSGTTSSVGANGSTAPTYSTEVGGIISLTQPNYTANNGALEAFSLDGYGNLRVAETGGAVGTYGQAAPTLATLDGALVSLTAPSYTSNNGFLEPLSMDGYGNLRVTLANGPVGTNGGTDPTTSFQAGGLATTSAPTYSDNTFNPISLDGYGNLRVAVSNSSSTPLYVIADKASNSTVTSVAITANSNNVLLAANAARIAATVYNATNKIVYIKYGATASSSNYTLQLMPNAYFEVQSDWAGEIDAWAQNGTTGSVLITELT